MTFRSPPPHRRSSGSRGGKSEFERTQLDLQALVRKIGFDNLPLNDETLRPALKILWDFAQAHNERVWVFDMADNDVSRGQLHHALMGDVVKCGALSRELGELLEANLSKEDLKRLHPVFTLKSGGGAILYFEGVYIPTAALASKRH